MAQAEMVFRVSRRMFGSSLSDLSEDSIRTAFRRAELTPNRISIRTSRDDEATIEIIFDEGRPTVDDLQGAVSAVGRAGVRVDEAQVVSV